MANEQKTLFDDDRSVNSKSVSVKLKARRSTPLTPAQRMFNRLTTQVEQLRIRLEGETRRLDKALAYHGEHLHPRRQRCAALRKEIVRVLAGFLDSNQLKEKRDRRELRELISEQLDMIVEEGGPIEDSDLRALFNQVHGVSYEALERQEIDATRSMMEAMLADFGVHIDLSDIGSEMNPEDLARKMAEMSETMRQQLQENEVAQQTQRKGKRQLKQEERMRQAEEARKKSITTIYRQLAKVLHPDLEMDEARRQTKVALMQDLTTAYHRKDLHTLLRLEMEWIQREEGDLERLSDEKLAIYNQVLRDQVSELQMEIESLSYHPRYAPLMVMDEFDINVRTDGPAEAHRLDIIIRGMEASLARMRDGAAEKEVRSVIKQHRAESRMRRRFERDVPF